MRIISSRCAQRLGGGALAVVAQQARRRRRFNSSMSEILLH
jgi:hypothetical protein